MKRSEINHFIQEARELFEQRGFVLPSFAFWTPEEWRSKGGETNHVRARKLGWDMTDFGSNDFASVGLLLFTLRNGLPHDPLQGYAEKIMIVREGQNVPFHFHFQKTEDIINRSTTGLLVVELYNAQPDGTFAGNDVKVLCDGVTRTVTAGGNIVLSPGESITLVPDVYHSFHALAGNGIAMIGEVSTVNDDANDNRFLKPLPRYPVIEEDVEPIHLLCSEYPPA